MRPAACQRVTGTCHDDHGVHDFPRRADARRTCNACGFPITVAQGFANATAGDRGKARTRPDADPFSDRRLDCCSHRHTLADTSTHAGRYGQRDGSRSPHRLLPRHRRPKLDAQTLLAQ